MSQIAPLLKMIENGQDSEMLRFTIGSSLFNEDNFDDAISHLQKAVELKPDYSAAWKILGRALAAAGRSGDAVVAFDQGLSVAATNGDKQTHKEITVFRKRVIKTLGQE